MLLGRVVGHVVATRKDEKLTGLKLLVVRGIDPAGEESASYHVAADTVDAGLGDRVLCVIGSSARMAAGMEGRPVDAAIVGVVDAVEVEPRGRRT
ncbi:MAG: EutN/CcmL family microcompartment protein [Acidobacteriota bacterium]